MQLIRKLAVAALLQTALAAGAADVLPAAAPAVPAAADAAAVMSASYPLLDLVPGGAVQTVRLTGTNGTQYFDFGIRNDESVTSAKLKLVFTASPSLLAETSQLNVYLNGQLQDTVTLKKDLTGKSVQSEVTLNPNSIREHNQISVQFIGHYQPVCENPTNEALWLTLDPASKLTVETERLRLSNDLARWPAPFIQASGTKPTVLPIVFAGDPDNEEKTAAAVFASAAGKIAGWRGIDFPVYYNTVPPEGHFIVFAADNKRPAFLKDMAPASGPEIRIADAPASRYAKMLVVSGKTTKDVVTAAKSFATSEHVLIGERLRIKDYKEPAVRDAYDVPRWIKTDSSVAFSDLMEYPGQLTAKGQTAPAVHLPLRLPPDLYLTGGNDLTLNLRYRYTKPSVGDTAQLRVLINNFLVDSVNLSDKDSRGEKTVHLPSFEGALKPRAEKALALGAVNDLRFELNYSQSFSEGTLQNCRSVTFLPHQLEIEPGSVVKLAGPYHWTELPNLSLFTQTGFPFSKYADLSQTALVTPKNATPAEVTSMLNAVGRIAAVTGLAAVHMTVSDNLKDPAVRDKDILYTGKLPDGELADFNEQSARALTSHLVDTFSKGEVTEGAAAKEKTDDAGAGVIVSFESPFTQGRTVVALLNEGERGGYELNTRLADPTALTQAAGSVSVVTEGKTLSFDTGSHFMSGNLPWYWRVWVAVSDHPFILIICAVLCALIVGTGIFRFMRRQIKERA